MLSENLIASWTMLTEFNACNYLLLYHPSVWSYMYIYGYVEMVLVTVSLQQKICWAVYQRTLGIFHISFVLIFIRTVSKLSKKYLLLYLFFFFWFHLSSFLPCLLKISPCNDFCRNFFNPTINNGMLFSCGVLYGVLFSFILNW